jgi:cell division protein FtsI/penicillin-binding protein 2
MKASANRLTLLCTRALAVFWLSSSTLAFASNDAGALTQALHGTQAAGIVLDLKTGAVTARAGIEARATPGSTIKPLLLEYALEHGVITSGAQVFCDRHLRIAGRTVDCTHPADRNVFIAESALAESCNRYFAELGRRFTEPQLEQALREARLEHRPVTNASAEDRELTALGLENVTTTPLDLAQAYRELTLRLPAGGPVERGLKESVDYGMAHPAAVEAMTILGKTGTAKNPGGSWTHGWFAGVLPGRIVVVIYVPHGDGGTAAALARQFFLAMRDAEAPR